MDIEEDMLKPSVKKQKVPQHGCCYSVFCCASNKPEQDEEINLARPIKMTPVPTNESKR